MINIFERHEKRRISVIAATVGSEKSAVLRRRAAEKKGDNWNGEKRQPRSIALLYGNAHFLVAAIIINGADAGIMPTYRSLLCTYDFFTRLVAFCRRRFGQRIGFLCARRCLFRPIIYIATWAE